MQPTDWHEIEEHQFAERVSEALERLVRARGAPALVVAAPPRTLADLREALHPDVKARIVLEIDRDFTNQPVWEIERHVVASLWKAPDRNLPLQRSWLTPGGPTKGGHSFSRSGKDGVLAVQRGSVVYARVSCDGRTIAHPGRATIRWRITAAFCAASMHEPRRGLFKKH